MNRGQNKANSPVVLKRERLASISVLNQQHKLYINQHCEYKWGRPFATSVCVMIDGPRRGLYKKKMKSLEKSGTSGNGSGGNGGDGGKGSSL